MSRQVKKDIEYILKLDNVSKTFGSVKAVKGISFLLKKGERVGLIGANGAGKTTISEMIIGINKPTSGTIKYGFTFERFPQEKVGMQFQDSIYPSGLSVKAIIKFALKLHKITMTTEKVLELLKIFQMEDFYNRTSRSLSGGQRQKLNILLSILHNPELVILDEISTGLDLSAREEIIKFVDKLLQERQITAILVSHHMEEIERLCERVIVLDKGEIIIDTTIKSVTAKHGSLSNLIKQIIDDSNVSTHNLAVSEIKKKKTLINFKTKKKEAK